MSVFASSATSTSLTSKALVESSTNEAMEPKLASPVVFDFLSSEQQL